MRDCGEKIIFYFLRFNQQAVGLIQVFGSLSQGEFCPFALNRHLLKTPRQISNFIGRFDADGPAEIALGDSGRGGSQRFNFPDQTFRNSGGKSQPHHQKEYRRDNHRP